MTDANHLEIAQDRLFRILDLLGAEAAQQVAWLQENGTYPSCDELGLEFEDSYLMAQQLQRAGLINSQALQKLSALDKHLSAMSGSDRAQLWQARALEREEEWMFARRLARDALNDCLALKNSPGG
jgi:hypothetical protein